MPRSILAVFRGFVVVTGFVVGTGYSKKDIDKILGGNLLRVLKANEE